MNRLSIYTLLIVTLLCLCHGGGKKSGVTSGPVDPSTLTTPPDDKIICYAGITKEKGDYIDINYLNEFGEVGVEGDVCDHTDPTADDEVRDSCYFYVKTGRAQWKRSCMHHSHCPLDGNMGCLAADGAVSCCCKGNYCNDYIEYAELGEEYSNEIPTVAECDMSELIRPCPCFATPDKCQDAQDRLSRTECSWDQERVVCTESDGSDGGDGDDGLEAPKTSTKSANNNVPPMYMGKESSTTSATIVTDSEAVTPSPIDSEPDTPSPVDADTPSPIDSGVETPSPIDSETPSPVDSETSTSTPTVFEQEMIPCGGFLPDCPTGYECNNQSGLPGSVSIGFCVAMTDSE